MVNAQTEPSKTALAKEVKASKHAKHKAMKKEAKEAKVEAAKEKK